MQHTDYPIDIFDAEGTIIGTKKRGDIDKRHDSFQVVYLLVCTSEKKMVLAKIPDNLTLPNLSVGKLGVSAATIVRHDERPEDAALRALTQDLDIEFARLHLLGSKWISLLERAPQKMTVYYCLQPHTIRFSSNDEQELMMVTRDELAELLKHPDQFAPSFLSMWERYRAQLPL